ncbi:hypothetical protein COO60DRAFT_895156 [Scenedesmus sp. NREL 46B-D3]|nr:hypothetical protein COO60DRAFT_895156 [Scenedesmus sp. NREL 46B-D3]
MALLDVVSAKIGCQPLPRQQHSMCFYISKAAVGSSSSSYYPFCCEQCFSRFPVAAPLRSPGDGVEGVAGALVSARPWVQVKVKLDGKYIGYSKRLKHSTSGACERLFEGFDFTNPSNGYIYHKAFKFGALAPAADAATVEHPDLIQAGRIDVTCKAVVKLGRTRAKVQTTRDGQQARPTRNCQKARSGSCSQGCKQWRAAR